MTLRTCIRPTGRFQVGLHRPAFHVDNLRQESHVGPLGELEDGSPVTNPVNFPENAVDEPCAHPIYEVANAFPFRGTTFINTAWADAKAARPDTIRIPAPEPCSFLQNMAGADKELDTAAKDKLLATLPRPLRRALAQASTDTEELSLLARQVARLVIHPDTHRPTGMGYTQAPNGNIIPHIKDHEVFEILVNNPHLPDDYKEAMVLRPGVQGRSEILGDYREDDAHVFEYLRRNSYIPWGHFASNMANDAVRYRAADLSPADMTGIRHLYYQRIFARMARALDLPAPPNGQRLTPEALEELRLQISQALAHRETPPEFTAALWGWNFGFGAAQCGHRLHASHQMIHQQNALIPHEIPGLDGASLTGFSCGDQITDLMADYRETYGTEFFKDYLTAIRTNVRTDNGHHPDPAKPASLVVWEDENAILFAPKAQTSEWELQLMTQAPCPHVLAADGPTRASLDQGILHAVQTLEKLGARMVTGVELSGRFYGTDPGQHLVYSFIPRLPYAPDTFSEAQLRYISGCYPEDFAQACRHALTPP